MEVTPETHEIKPDHIDAYKELLALVNKEPKS